MAVLIGCSYPGCGEAGEHFCAGQEYCRKHYEMRSAEIQLPDLKGMIKPDYYQAAVLEKNTRKPVAIECFDVIDALGLDFYTGNALKYLWRAGKKEGASKVSDLKKIRTFIDAALQREGEEKDD